MTEPMTSLQLGHHGHSVHRPTEQTLEVAEGKS